MSLLGNILIQQGLALANPIAINEAELELQKIHDSDPESFKLCLEAITTLTNKLTPKLGTTVGAQVVGALLGDLHSAAVDSAKANGITL